MGNLSQKKRLLIISTANQVSLDRNFCLLLVKSPSNSDPVKPGSVSLVVPKVGLHRAFAGFYQGVTVCTFSWSFGFFTVRLARQLSAFYDLYISKGLAKTV
jgi:hypothetical protein